MVHVQYPPGKLTLDQVRAALGSGQLSPGAVRSPGLRVHRGGYHFDTGPEMVRATYRIREAALWGYTQVGARCARSVSP
jgi:hypothetical protein